MTVFISTAEKELVSHLPVSDDFPAILQNSGPDVAKALSSWDLWVSFRISARVAHKQLLQRRRREGGEEEEGVCVDRCPLCIAYPLFDA